MIPEKNPVLVELIESLGGYSELSKELGLEKQTVHKWQYKGIPVKYWKRLLYAHPRLTIYDLAHAHISI